ncbi:MAG: hypothetical protein AAB704_00305 [Patescibacteria group bacterium]
MKKTENNFAYIDGANLYNGISGFGWALDYARLRTWLSEKYAVKNAYIFIGLIPKYKELYKQKSILQARKEKAPDGDKTP